MEHRYACPHTDLPRNSLVPASVNVSAVQSSMTIWPHLGAYSHHSHLVFSPRQAVHNADLPDLAPHPSCCQFSQYLLPRQFTAGLSACRSPLGLADCAQSSRKEVPRLHLWICSCSSNDKVRSWAKLLVHGLAPFLGSSKMNRISQPLARILKVYTEALPAFGQYWVQMVSATPCSLKVNGSSCEDGGRKVIPKTGWSEEPFIALVQFTGQLVIMSSWWPPPTNGKVFEVCLRGSSTLFCYLAPLSCIHFFRYLDLWTSSTIETTNCLMLSFSLWLKLILTNVLTP